MPALAAILVTGSAFLFLAYLVRAQALRPAESRLRVLSPRAGVSVSTAPDGATLLRRGTGGTVLGRLLDASRYSRRWQFELERADLKLRPSEYFLVRLMIAVVTVLIVSLIGRNSLAFVIGLFLGAIMYMMPAYWIQHRIKSRIQQINRQLLEAVVLIGNALRAGFAFAQGVDVAAKRVGPPMSVELNRMLIDVNLGMTTEDALQEMNARIGSDDVDMVVTAILIQRTTGGNLAEVLENVTETMRERERIQGEIKTLTSQQRLTAWILSLWPIALGVLFTLMNPSMMKLMVTTSIGQILLIIWTCLTITATVLYAKILDLDV